MTVNGRVVVTRAAHAKMKLTTEVVGTKSVTVQSGRTATVAITLNATGQRLIARFGKLPCRSS